MAEQSEFEEPLRKLKEQGADVEVISLKRETIKAWKNKNRGMEVDPDLSINEAKSRNCDALVLPGGIMNPRCASLEYKIIQAYFQ